MKVFLDDERVPPNHTWVTVRNAESAIKLLELGDVEVISLDHDLGACDSCMNGRSVSEWLEEHSYQSMPYCEHVGTGYDVLLRIEELQQEQPNFSLPIIQIHTANSGARVKMELARNAIYQRANRV